MSELPYTIIKEIDDNNVLIRCNTCGQEFSYTKINLFKFHHTGRAGKCLMGFHSQVVEKYVKEFAEKFYRIARGAKNRVTNPKNKDYESYSNLGWGFKDNIEYTQQELDKFAKAVEKYGLDSISIDRIDGTRGYYHDNIRFVPMSINLGNKEICKQVKCTDLSTGVVKIYANAHQCGLSLNINPSRVRDCCVRGNHRYKNLYVFEYL